MYSTIKRYFEKEAFNLSAPTLLVVALCIQLSSKMFGEPISHSVSQIK